MISKDKHLRSLLECLIALCSNYTDKTEVRQDRSTVNMTGQDVSGPFIVKRLAILQDLFDLCGHST
jgi:hypothetical protein